MKTAEELKKFKQHTVIELLKMIQDIKSDIFKSRFEVNFGKTKNVSRIRKLKKQIARIKTIVNEKLLKEEE
ncbi:MAG: hypothetical protein CEN91_84 [Candidatus Berkelbacteria bacterium Licking1014_85]|uniref:Large ribosomal subunit protein uL29 n=1 Tax=Candidatus Berkelbacteria bacterium Licking1014_85 TaxID=2017148 RepID=A0A554LLZ5_9BACT|nr:MAG: hypothetical protein CEN91_84 [Candidatus Berkelbacteria bacterium Licking1014_85]